MDRLWTLLKVAVAVGTIGVLYSWSQKNDSEQQGQRRQSQQPPQQQQKPPPPPQPQQLQPNQRAPPQAPQQPPPQQVLQLQQQPNSWAQVADTGNQNHQHQQQPKPYSYNPATIHEEETTDQEDESYHEGEYSSESEYSEYDESNEGEYTDDQQEEEDEEDEEDDSCDCGRPYLLIRGVHICRYYGRFQCKCGNRWTSAYTWRGETQGCRSCGRASHPWKTEPLVGGRGNNIQGAHDRPRCSMCRRLGIDCSLEFNDIRR